MLELETERHVLVSLPTFFGMDLSITNEVVLVWIAAIEHEAGLLLGKEVHLRIRVDTDILGGLFIQVGDFVLDGTIDRLLEDIQQNLIG